MPGTYQAPKNKVAVNITYTWDFDAGSLTPSFSYIWRDVQYSNLFERGYNKAPVWTQLDGRISWRSRDGHYTIIGYVKNILNDLGYDGGASGSRVSGVYAASTIAALGLRPGTPGTVPGTFNAVQGVNTTYAVTPPRTYGIEFQYRF